MKAKVVSFFGIISLLLVVLGSIFAFRQEKDAYIQGMQEKLVAAAYAVEMVLPDDYHERIEDGESIGTDEYHKFRKVLQDYAEPLELKWVYTYMKFGDKIRTTASNFPDGDIESARTANDYLTKYGAFSEMPPEVQTEVMEFIVDWYGEDEDWSHDPWGGLEGIQDSVEFFYEYKEPSKALVDAFDGKIGTPVFDSYDDPEYGPLHSAFIPLKTKNGKTYVIGADKHIPLVEAQLQQTLIKILIAAVVFSVLFCAATYLALRSISRPIDSLLGTAREISEKGDYRLRAEKISQDELGELVDGFNEMLDEIEKRRKQLGQHRDNLETEVEKRTAELVEVNQDLKLAKQDAERANEAKSFFLANMTHELRTPLNAVIGYSEMLLEDAEDSGDEDYVSDLVRIRAAGKHLLNLISNILDFSKIEAGKMTVFPEWGDLNEVISEVSSTIQPLVDKGKNQLVVDASPDLGKIYTDQTKLRQLLFNLLSNAAKFTSSGTVTLSVSRKAEGEGEDERIRIVVSDTGIGMSPEQVDKLFSPFTQADDSTSRKFGGTGLGLAITREFCQMLAGTISLESELEKGSTFSIELPAVFEGEEGDSSESEEKDSGVNTGGKGAS